MRQDSKKLIAESTAKEKEGRELFRDMMEQSPLPITIISPEGQILQANNAWYRDWGLNYEEGERVFAKYNILTDKEIEAQGFMPLLKKAFAGESVILPPMQYQAKNTMKRIGLDQLNPNTVWIQCHYFSVKDEHQKVKFVVCTNLDLTKEKQAEKQMNQIRSELIHATRRSTMGELTAALAHELNQPLAAILSNAQAAKRFLDKKKPDIDEVRDILVDIAADDNRAKEIILRLRSLMKRAEMKFKELDINDVINDVISLVRSDSIIRNVDLKTQLKMGLPKLLGDPIQLQQVIINLVLNGFEAMDNLDQKKLVICTENDDPESVTICVQDSGHGINEDDADQLFKPFISMKKEGMGMGLSIARNIVEAHGGKIWAKNNPDKGSTFCFSLPINREGNDEEG